MPSAIEQGIDLANTARPSEYGHPYHDFTKTAGMLTSLGYSFTDSNGVKRNMIPEDIAIFMMCVKVSRETHKHKDDNLVDICGYARTIERVLEYRSKNTPKVLPPQELQKEYNDSILPDVGSVEDIRNILMQHMVASGRQDEAEFIKARLDKWVDKAKAEKHPETKPPIPF